MKVIIIGAVVVVVIFVLFQSFVVMPLNRTEERKHSLVRKYKGFEIRDSVSTMSFVMPSAYSKENLPKPNDPNVQIQITDNEYVAVIRFGGYASDEDLKFYSQKLENLLKEKGITSLGNYRFLGYNPPFQPVGRRNEIIVTVDWAGR